VVGLGVLIALLGWIGLWGAIGAAVDRTAETFGAFTDADIRGLDADKRVEAFRNLLWGLSVAAGAMVAVVTLGLSGWRTWTEGRRADTERRKLETETFAKAIEQLGNKDFAIRLGAILNLETLAQTSPRLHQPILEAFCAYIREKARTPSPLEKESPPLSTDDAAGKDGDTSADDSSDHDAREETKRRVEEIEHRNKSIRQAINGLKPFRTDLQAIVTALGRRTVTQDRPGYRLDLRGANLRKADLSEGHFQGADLASAHLEGANLEGAHLEGALMWDAHLEGAILWDAHLEGAVLIGANLEGANLQDANLEGAVLRGAHLQGADLIGAHLEGADLEDAHLEGADLIGAHLEGADLEDAHLECAALYKAHLEGADLGGAHLEGATLWGANLDGADLRGAHLEGARLYNAHLEGADLPLAHLEGADITDTDVTQDQLDAASGDAKTLIPDHLTRPAHWTGPDDTQADNDDPAGPSA